MLEHMYAYTTGPRSLEQGTAQREELENLRTRAFGG